MQQRESDQHRQALCPGQQQQPGAMHEHAKGRQQPLVEPVTEGHAGQHAGNLRGGHERDDQRGLRHGIAERLLDERDRMDIDCSDRQQRKAVTERDQPEGPRAQRLAGGELDNLIGRGIAASGLGRPPVAVDLLAKRFRAILEKQRNRPAQHDDQHTGPHRGRAPSEGLHRGSHQRHEQAADRHAEPDDRQRAGPVALEPVDHRDIDREIAGQAGAKRDHDQRCIKAAKRIDPAERDHAGAEDHDASPNQPIGSDAVAQPAECRADHGRLHRLQRRTARQRGLAPAFFSGEHRHIGTESLLHQGGLKQLQGGARGDHAPTVKSLHERVDCVPHRPIVPPRAFRQSQTSRTGRHPGTRASCIAPAT